MINLLLLKNIYKERLLIIRAAIVKPKKKLWDISSEGLSELDSDSEDYNREIKSQVRNLNT